jgi:sporulation protein YabP
MEEIIQSGAHRALLSNRKTGNFTGILDVLSFDVSQILLETEMGMLIVKGKDLHVNRLNLEKGEVDLDGLITSLEYSDVPKPGEKAAGVLGRLFK